VAPVSEVTMRSNAGDRCDVLIGKHVQQERCAVTPPVGESGPVEQDQAAYWDHYAAATTENRSDADGVDLDAAFGWTQYNHHGPGIGLLGSPSTALDLGCGNGTAVAALATAGISAVGIDLSTTHLGAARARWGQLQGARFVHADAVAYLRKTDLRWDAIFSVWAAVWFSDPKVLLPLIHQRLSPGGRLVFCHSEPPPDSDGAQGIYVNGFRVLRAWLYRWAYPPATWARMLTDGGFSKVDVWIEPAPQPGQVGTLIATAQAQP
jgi:SAM-dependent methyltransferase